MRMDHQGAVPLDGNAAGGLLNELFAADVTAAEMTCGGCGAVAAIGAVRVYGGPMGAILRCAHCDTVLLGISHTPAGLWLDLHGARKMFVARPDARAI